MLRLVIPIVGILQVCWELGQNFVDFASSCSRQPLLITLTELATYKKTPALAYGELLAKASPRAEASYLLSGRSFKRPIQVNIRSHRTIAGRESTSSQYKARFAYLTVLPPPVFSPQARSCEILHLPLWQRHQTA